MTDEQSKTSNRDSIAMELEASLLLSRRKVADQFGMSTATVKRLEAAGRLRPIRLTRSPNAMVHYKASDVLALIEESFSKQVEVKKIPRNRF